MLYHPNCKNYECKQETGTTLIGVGPFYCSHPHCYYASTQQNAHHEIRGFLAT